MCNAKIGVATKCSANPDTWNSADGKGWKVCKDCFAKFGEHDCANASTSYPNTDEQGNYKLCSTCNSKIYENTCAAGSHEYSANWVPTDVAGSHKRVCSKCGAQEVEPCKYGKEWLGEGNIRYKECTICGSKSETHNCSESSAYKSNGDDTHSVTCKICERALSTEPCSTTKTGTNAWVNNDPVKDSNWKQCDKCEGKFDEHPCHSDSDYTYEGNEGWKICSECNDPMKRHTCASTKTWVNSNGQGWKVCDTCSRHIGEHKCSSGQGDGWTQDGKYAYQTCNECGFRLYKGACQEEHQWGSWTYKDGQNKHERQCTACGQRETESCSISEWTGTGADDNNKRYQECSVCGEKFTEHICAANNNAKYTHDEADGTVNSYRLCKDCGQKIDEHTCVASFNWSGSESAGRYKLCTHSGCGYKFQDHICGNNLSSVHDSDGKGYHTQKCTICQISCAKTPCSDNNWMETNGERYKTCSAPGCNYEIPNSRHTCSANWGKYQAVADKDEHYRVCTFCGKHEENSACSSADNKWFGNQHQRYQTCKDCGAAIGVHECSGKDVVLTDSNGNNYHECSVCGQAVYATFCIDGNHTWGNYTSVGAGQHSRQCFKCAYKEKDDCTTFTWIDSKTLKGYRKQVCSDCGGAINSHKCSENMGDFVIIKEATCTEAGFEESTCTICEEKKVTEPISMLSHTDSGKYTVLAENGVAKKHKICSVCNNYYGDAESITESDAVTTFDATTGRPTNGTSFLFGSYNGNPIAWKMYKYTHDNTTELILLTDRVLYQTSEAVQGAGRKGFGPTQLWDASYVRADLDPTNANDTLSLYSLNSVIKEVSHAENGNGDNNYSTKDKVYLLSEAEVTGIFTTAQQRKCWSVTTENPTYVASDKTTPNSDQWYWLRSPNPGSASWVRHVSTSGSVGYHGLGDGNGGVRPALQFNP